MSDEELALAIALSLSPNNNDNNNNDNNDNNESKSNNIISDDNKNNANITTTTTQTTPANTNAGNANTTTSTSTTTLSENIVPSSSSSSSFVSSNLIDLATQNLIHALSSHEDEVRVTMLVRTDLKMGVGKMCAQCSHSAVGIYSIMQSSSNPVWKNYLLRWENGGAAKIALKCPDIETLRRLEQQARSLGLPTYIIQDLGRTQVPSGSITVCAIAGPKSILDTVTGKLKLL